MNVAMDIIKKNLISIICAVIALLAIGAVFWPIRVAGAGTSGSTLYVTSSAQN